MILEQVRTAAFPRTGRPHRPGAVVDVKFHSPVNQRIAESGSIAAPGSISVCLSNPTGQIRSMGATSSAAASTSTSHLADLYGDGATGRARTSTP